MNNQYQVYMATLEDIDEIIGLRVALLKEVGEIQSEQDAEHVVNDTRKYLEETLPNNEFISYIAKSNGKVVSISGAVLFKRPPYLDNLKGIEAYVLNMYTLPQFRGKGLAKKLLEECIKYCKQKEVKRVWLHASEGGKSLYEKIGFTFKNSEMELFL